MGYTSKEWYATWAALAQAGGVVVDGGIRTLAALANRGVFYSVENRLAVTNPGAAANRIAVNTGAALVEGAFFRNDASIDAAGDITSPAANPRIDRVVVRKNYSAAAYVPTAASAALFTVPAYTARVTVIHGAEAAGPVAPSLTQDVNRATYWDIPLYQYQISVAGAITALTDEREWADAETSHLFVSATAGWNNTDSTLISLTTNAALAPNSFPQIILPDSKDSYVSNFFALPPRFISGTVTGVCQGNAGAANIVAGIFVISGNPCDEVFGGDATYGVVAAEAMVNGIQFFSCQGIITIPAGLVEGNMVAVTFERDATDPLDTVGGAVNFWGFLVEYLRWR